MTASLHCARLHAASLLIRVTEEGQAGEARRTSATWAGESGLSAELCARVALVVTELAKNLALHTTEGGVITLRLLGRNGQRGAGILSLDRGPGVDNFSLCLRDGYSTAGTAGTGLGAIQRMTRTMETHSQRGLGTAIYTELWSEKEEALQMSEVVCGAVSTPIRGERLCGDTWREQVGPGWVRYLMADGLGHGPLASEAALCADEVFRACAGIPLPEVLRRMHEKLRSTRGAAVGIAHLDLAASTITFCGVGNIAGAVHTPEKASSLVSHNGTVGAAFPSEARAYLVPWPQDSLLVMHSDGLKTSWQLARYAGVGRRHPELVAGVLYRDYLRGTDDATVLVARRRT